MRNLILSINVISFFCLAGCDSKKQVNLNMIKEPNYTIGYNTQANLIPIQSDTNHENLIEIPVDNWEEKIFKRRVIEAINAYAAFYERVQEPYTSGFISRLLESGEPLMIDQFKKTIEPNLDSEFPVFDIDYMTVAELNLVSKQFENEVQSTYVINSFFSELIKIEQKESPLLSNNCDSEENIKKTIKLNSCAFLMNYIDFLGALSNKHGSASNITLAIIESLHLKSLYITKPYMLDLDKDFVEYDNSEESKPVEQDYEEYVKKFHDELYNFTSGKYFEEETSLLSLLSISSKNSTNRASLIKRKLNNITKCCSLILKENSEAAKILERAFNIEGSIQSIFEILSEGFEIAVKNRNRKEEESCFLNSFFSLYEKLEDCYLKQCLSPLEENDKSELESFSRDKYVSNYIESLSTLHIESEEVEFMLQILPLAIFLNNYNANNKIDNCEHIIEYLVKKVISELRILNEEFYELCSDREIFYKKNNKKNTKKETQIVIFDPKSKNGVFDKRIEILRLEKNQILLNEIKKIFMQKQALRFLIDNKGGNLMTKTYGFENNNEPKLLLAGLIVDYLLCNKIRVKKDILSKKLEFAQFVSKKLEDFHSHDVSEILNLPEKYKNEIFGKVNSILLSEERFLQIIENENKKINRGTKKHNSKANLLAGEESESLIIFKQEFLNEIISEEPIIFNSLERKRNFIKDLIHPYNSYDYAEYTYKKYASLPSSEFFVCTLVHEGGFCIPILYSVRSGFFFTNLSKNIFMVDIDFTSEEKDVRELTVKDYLDYLQNYATKHDLIMQVSESTNGMHVYVNSHNLMKKEIIEHMSNLVCDPDYTSSIFNDENNGSIRISPKIFEKNINGFGYLKILKNFEEIKKDFVEKPLKNFIPLSEANNELNNFTTILTNLNRIINPLKDIMISLMNNQYFQAWSLFLKSNYKHYSSNEELTQSASPFIYFLAQNIHNRMYTAETGYTALIDERTYFAFQQRLPYNQATINQVQYAEFLDSVE